MAITKRSFGKTADGKEVTLYSIKNNNGYTVEVTDFGAILVNLLVPDRNGTVTDIALGHDSVEGYFINGDFMGAVIGPSANRIDNASFTIDGVKYQLAVNDGTNNLHSDMDKGYHKRMWNVEEKDNTVTFSLEDPDGSMGFPGNKKVHVS
jgi:aldose 1-epimerase